VFAIEVVKGLTRRVVVLRFPDTKLFEQAIFILSDGARKTGVSADEVVREAQAVARRYAPSAAGRPAAKSRLWPLALGLLLGALMTAAVWLIWFTPG
jgi:hypothetical protein